MPVKSKEILKTYFETGDIPTQHEFEDLIDSMMTQGYSFVNVAFPNTVPISPEGKVFYLASTPGTYSGFGGIVLVEGETALLKWDGIWSKQASLVGGTMTMDVPVVAGQSLTQALLYGNFKAGDYVNFTVSGVEDTILSTSYLVLSGLVGTAWDSTHIYRFRNSVVDLPIRIPFDCTGLRFVRSANGIAQSGTLKVEVRTKACALTKIPKIDVEGFLVWAISGISIRFNYEIKSGKQYLVKNIGTVDNLTLYGCEMQYEGTSVALRRNIRLGEIFILTPDANYVQIVLNAQEGAKIVIAPIESVAGRLMNLERIVSTLSTP